MRKLYALSYLSPSLWEEQIIPQQLSISMLSNAWDSWHQSAWGRVMSIMTIYCWCSLRNFASIWSMRCLMTFCLTYTLFFRSWIFLHYPPKNNSKCTRRTCQASSLISHLSFTTQPLRPSSLQLYSRIPHQKLGAMLMKIKVRLSLKILSELNGISFLFPTRLRESGRILNFEYSCLYI